MGRKDAAIPAEQVSAPLSVDAELEKKLELYFELRKTAGQYEKLKKELADLFNGVERLRIGRFLVTGSRQTRGEKVMRAYDFWSWKVDEVPDFQVLAAAQGEDA